MSVKFGSATIGERFLLIRRSIHAHRNEAIEILNDNLLPDRLKFVCIFILSLNAAQTYKLYADLVREWIRYSF